MKEFFKRFGFTAIVFLASIIIVLVIILFASKKTPTEPPTQNLVPAFMLLYLLIAIIPALVVFASQVLVYYFVKREARDLTFFILLVVRLSLILIANTVFLFIDVIFTVVGSIEIILMGAAGAYELILMKKGKTNTQIQTTSKPVEE